MKQWHKISAAILGSAIVTFLITAYVVHSNSTRNTVGFMMKASIEMESLNDIGRIEAFDFVEEMIKKGCTKEALEFIDYQQALLLSGLHYQMLNSDGLKDKVFERDSSIGERAVRKASRAGSYTYPKCK